METISERVAQLLEEKKLTCQEAGRLSGVVPSVVWKMVNNATAKPQDRNLQKLADFFQVSFDWLKRGTGKREITPPGDMPPPGETAGGLTTVRYFQIDATAGDVEVFDDETRADFIDIRLPGFTGCKHAVNVSGDSMYPVISPGDIVILREWVESFIAWGSTYLVVTRTGNRMIKELQPGGNASSVLCVSTNTRHKPFEIQAEDIYRLFLVKGRISKLEI